MQVHENDIVYVLGDFIMGKKLDDVIKILNKLNGRIHLILGNHDTLLSNKNISLPNKVVVHNDIVQTKLYNG
jgi:calcineurin-like phosphoesterase family protein